uniref:Small integral membrane protein 4 n=1 Tax=Meloidogyne hapla TaxID=6305 RepID=A0A1I8BRF2_MELHA
MLLSLARLSRRPDTRPLYRRLFTNRRLDILHLTTVRFINIAFIPYVSSFLLTTGFIYYAYEKPIRKQERRRLELEILQAQLAGFKFKEEKQ